MGKLNPVTKANRIYRRDLLLAMGAYVIIIMVAVSWVNSLPQENNWRYVIVLAPVVPLLIALGVFMRWLRQVDEFERRLNFEAFGFSLGITFIITLTLGFLERAGFPRLDLIWVPIMMIGLWGFGLAIARRRYQ
jgi:predicted ferric reductase